LVGRELSVSASDSGTNMGDMIGDNQTDQPCNFDSRADGPVSHGNINIRSGA
jgi:hypothetical protein